MNFQQYFKQEFEVCLNKNLKRIYKDAVNGEPDTLDKIQRYADKWNINPDYVRQELINRNEWALRQLAIDPGRQNISEKTQADFNNIKLQPTRNPYKWEHDGVFTKTIDGTWHDRFVFMKVIRQHGGQQEDVKREAEEFIRIVNNSEDKFIVLIDDFTKPNLDRYTGFVKDHTKIWVLNSDELANNRKA